VGMNSKCAGPQNTHQVFQMHGLINKSQTVKINHLNAFDNTLYSKKKLFF